MPTRHVEAEIILRWVRDAAGFEVTLLYDNPDDNHDYQEFVSTTLRLDTVDPVGYPPAFKGESGWWDFTHESRLDLAQLCGSVFLLLVGAGHYFLDTLNRTTVANSAPR